MVAMPHGPFRPQLRNLLSDRDRADGDFDSIEHLSAEAIAGFVDSELPPVAMGRARVHLVHCPECRAEVQAQRRAAERLRQGATGDIAVPSSLLDKLNSIARSCPEGPEAEELPRQRSETFVAKVETFYRAVKRAQGK